MFRRANVKKNQSFTVDQKSTQSQNMLCSAANIRANASAGDKAQIGSKCATSRLPSFYWIGEATDKILYSESIGNHLFDLCQENYVEECLCCSYVGHVVYTYINEASCLLLKFKLNILVLFSLPREKNVGEKEFVSVLKGSFYRTAFMSILPNSL